MINALVWLRCDFRIADNPALFHAIKHAQNAGSSVIALLILSPKEDFSHDRAPVQVDFMLRNARHLSNRLWEDHHIPLLCREAKDAKDVQEIMDSVVSKYQIGHVLFNNQYEVDESRRDDKFVKRMQDKGVKVSRFHDQVIVPPRKVTKQNGEAHQVFTQFRMAWTEYLRNNPNLLRLYQAPAFENELSALDKIGIAQPENIPEFLAQFQLSKETRTRMQHLYPEGEEFAQKRLGDFCDNWLSQYKEKRDLPALPSTSGMSVYLSTGVISLKQCFVKAMELNGQSFEDKNGHPSIVKWIHELIWREFFKHILVFYPRVCMNQPLQLETKSIKWRFEEKEFKAWCEGKTGYPMVDAGMRQLNETGWMHNRTRQICASFLTKHLLHDWRLGEKYYMEHLIDGDFAANNGGWQWTASTGTDSRGTRIFNPIIQAEKYDVEGSYIKRYVPELAGVNDPKALRDPTKLLGRDVVKKLGYVPAIVNYGFAVKRAQEAFRQ